MMCKNCKHAFCWYCLESLDVSTRRGALWVGLKPEACASRFTEVTRSGVFSVRIYGNMSSLDAVVSKDGSLCRSSGSGGSAQAGVQPGC